MTAYYNEFDHAAACGLRELIKLGVIAPGDVDERSITEVKPDDIKGYTQCHFFAGAGVWSYALRSAGWPDDRPVWTGSCPCQDFSCAGQGKGTRGDRDLWPVFAALVRECRPDRVFGEQVEAAIGYGWLDRLRTDMEAEGYAVGGVVLGAHSAGAPHIRQRLYWVADSECNGRNERRSQRTGLVGCFTLERGSEPNGLAESENNGRRGQGREEGDGERARESGAGFGGVIFNGPSERGGACRVADSETSIGRGVRTEHAGGRLAEAGGSSGTGGMGIAGKPGLEGQRGDGNGGDQPGWINPDAQRYASTAGARHFWSRAVAIPCRDGKARLAEPGIFPLVDVPSRSVVHLRDQILQGNEKGEQEVTEEYANSTSEARQMRLKWYGNAIVSETAVRFVEAYMEGQK